MTLGYSVSHHALERWRQRVDAEAEASDVKKAAAAAVPIPVGLSHYFGELRPGTRIMWSAPGEVIIVTHDGPDGAIIIVTCYPPKRGQARLLARLGA